MCQHKWQPLFAAPTDRDRAETRIDWLFLRAQAYRICACGAVGVQGRGYLRGGGHRIHCLADEAEREKLRGEAAAWNARLQKERGA